MAINKTPMLKKISETRSSLTPKGKILGDYILKNTSEVVFMTTKELSVASGVSEATIMRFVTHLQYRGYTDFIQELRDMVHTELTLVDRLELVERNGSQSKHLHSVINKEIDNLKQLYNELDLEATEKAIGLLQNSANIFIIGSRLSYSLAYYMGWVLMKIRRNVQILKGSDTTAIDWLTVAPAESLVVIIATSRYPNDLIKTGKYARRLGHSLLLITDGSFCPLIHFAEIGLVAPSRHIPYVGSMTNLSCFINYLLHELAHRSGEELPKHQGKLEKSYLENDLLFHI